MKKRHIYAVMTNSKGQQIITTLAQLARRKEQTIQEFCKVAEGNDIVKIQFKTA